MRNNNHDQAEAVFFIEEQESVLRCYPEAACND